MDFFFDNVSGHMIEARFQETEILSTPRSRQATVSLQTLQLVEGDEPTLFEPEELREKMRRLHELGQKALRMIRR